MNTQPSSKKDLYYTKDHEWIDFQGSVAYTGVCSFKLIGFRAIEQVIFNEPLGLKKRGDLIATIKYNDYIIEAHMPVDGKVLEMNTNLIYGDNNLLLKYAESVWIAKIAPSLPHERKDLLPPKQYQMNGKSKYAK
jgi:glycine cleavage system H protein